MSIGSHSSQKCQTCVHKKGGTSPIWNQTLHLQLQQAVQFLLFEISSGKSFLGSARLPMSEIGDPRDFAIKLADSKGKHAGMLNVTLQLYTGDIHQALNMIKQSQAAWRPVGGGGFTQPVQQQTGGGFMQAGQPQQQQQRHAGGFGQPIAMQSAHIIQQGGGGGGGGGFSQPPLQQQHHQQQQSSVAGGFQQPSVAPSSRPIGGFTVAGSQQAGGAGRSADQAGFSTPETVPANSMGFQGHHQQQNLTERGEYVPQAGASCDGSSAYALHPPQPLHTPAAVLSPPSTSSSPAVVTQYEQGISYSYQEESMPTGKRDEGYAYFCDLPHSCEHSYANAMTCLFTAFF
jgi:hypothetical protein